MVPTAIVGRAKSLGLDMIGICDHNSAENVAAVVEAGRRHDVAIVPGIEVTSREEVHILGLFPAEHNALRMQELIYDNLPGTNDEQAFGPQTVVDSWDRPVRANGRLLIGATTLGLDDVVDAIHRFGGLAVASHVDRPSFSLISQLGMVPDGLKLDALELSPRARSCPRSDLPVMTSSDAHTLGDIGRSFTRFFIEQASVEEIAKALRDEGGRRVSISMEDLSLHILDIVENSLSAAATWVGIRIVEDSRKDLRSLEVSDNGKGMDAETRQKALDPFFTTRSTRRVGLGLPLLAQAARESGGTFELLSEPGRGTTVKATFQLSHPDCKPLGNLVETLRTIVVGRPDLRLDFEYHKDSKLIAKLGGSEPPKQEWKHGSSDD